MQQMASKTTVTGGSYCLSKHETGAMWEINSGTIPQLTNARTFRKQSNLREAFHNGIKTKSHHQTHNQ